MEKLKIFFSHKTNNNEAKKLAEPVYRYMMHRLLLLPEYLDRLRCFEYDGTVNGKQVICIRIFSPNMARKQHLSIKSNSQLAQHPQMLLFEGYVDSQHKVYVADWRARAKPTK
jgi:hypothetical protein